MRYQAAPRSDGPGGEARLLADEQMRATTKLAAAFWALLAMWMMEASTIGLARAEPTVWVQRPSAQQIEEAYPEKAKEAGIGGHAWVGCDLTRAGFHVKCFGQGES